MSRCPKCGSHKIIGPKYHTQFNGFQLERLGYTCFQCGYSMTTPTRDAEKKDPTQKASGR